MQADHDLVFELLAHLTGGAGRPEGSLDDHRRYAKQLVALFSVHEAAEELVVWPEVRRRCPEGDNLILQATDQEKKAKWAVNELNRVKPGNSEFDECVDTVASHARAHITYEQNQIWPRLSDHLTGEEAAHLANRFVAARKKAPTRPHPHTPPVPSVLGSFGALVARIDRTRDALTGRTVPTP